MSKTKEREWDVWWRKGKWVEREETLGNQEEYIQKEEEETDLREKLKERERWIVNE